MLRQSVDKLETSYTQVQENWKNCNLSKLFMWTKYSILL